MASHLRGGVNNPEDTWHARASDACKLASFLEEATPIASTHPQAPTSMRKMPNHIKWREASRIFALAKSPTSAVAKTRQALPKMCALAPCRRRRMRERKEFANVCALRCERRQGMAPPMSASSACLLLEETAQGVGD